MGDNQTTEGQRFWVWAPGMLATTQDGRRKVRITEYTLGVGHEMVPDLSDAATVAAIARTAQAEAESLRAELAQARADRALLAGLWLIVVHHDVLPALLPTDQGDRDRLADALDAVDRQPGAEARIAAGRAVIARIVAETGGGAA